MFHCLIKSERLTVGVLIYDRNAGLNCIFIKTPDSFKFWQYRRTFGRIVRLFEQLRDYLPGFTWRVQHDCDSGGMAYFGSLEFNWQRRKGYSGMYGDGPDSISPVSLFTGLKLIISKKTYQYYN